MNCADDRHLDKFGLFAHTAPLTEGTWRKCHREFATCNQFSVSSSQLAIPVVTVTGRPVTVTTGIS